MLKLIPFVVTLVIARSEAFTVQKSACPTASQVSAHYVTTAATQHCNRKQHHPYKRVTHLSESKGDKESDEIRDNSVIAKASWYATEAFGKLFGSSESKAESIKDGNADGIIDLDANPSSLGETIKRIQLDNDRFYFLSGKVDALSYDPKCYFADPFVGFEGTDRFVENLQNLGSFITKYDVKVLNYDISVDQLEVKTRLMVKLQLNLPWKPILAWPWGVKYEINPKTFLIESHIESWDIKAIEGVKQIFRKPTLEL